MISNETIAEFFDRPVEVINNERLREPQRLGHAAAVKHFATERGRVVEQVPVGCGKSGLITLLPFGCARGRVLVIAPNLTISGQLADAFNVTSPQGCFYRTAKIFTDFTAGPWVASLDREANRSDMDDAHVVVTNIQQLASGGGRWLEGLPVDYFDLIIVDEGHHGAAPTWRDVFARFPDAKIISLTATPFRADGQPVEGEMIYRYPISEAMRQGYIKYIRASNVAPEELTFSYRGDERVHTLEEVLALREKTWFSRGVALSERCNISIVDASMEWLKHLRRRTSLEHQIIAVACSKDHAEAIRGLYEERDLVAQEIHSGMDDDVQEGIKRRLRSGELDVIVQVAMLGEGFDHPPLSVAAVFRPYRSLSPYIQFVGRIMRVNEQNAPGHRDNQGVVVSHVGLNIDQHWADFKSIDEEDQRLVEAWLSSHERKPTDEPQGGRRPLRPDMIVRDERTLDAFLGDQYLDIPQESLPERILELLQAEGIDPAAAGLSREMLEVLQQNRADTEPSGPVEQPVQPQARRKVLRRRLREQARTLAMGICTSVGLNPTGRRIASRMGAQSDLEAVIRLVNSEVNRFLDIPSGYRGELDIEQIERAQANLDALGDAVEADVKKRIS